MSSFIVSVPDGLNLFREYGFSRISRFLDLRKWGSGQDREGKVHHFREFSVEFCFGKRIVDLDKITSQFFAIRCRKKIFMQRNLELKSKMAVIKNQGVQRSHLSCQF